MSRSMCQSRPRAVTTTDSGPARQILPGGTHRAAGAIVPRSAWLSHCGVSLVGAGSGCWTPARGRAGARAGADAVSGNLTEAQRLLAAVPAPTFARVVARPTDEQRQLHR